MKYYVKSALVLIIIISLSLCSSYTDTTLCAAEFQITDPFDDKVYNITHNTEDVNIIFSEGTVTFPINATILDAICYNSVFSFLCIAEGIYGNGNYSVYFYNLRNSSLSFTSLDLTSQRNTHIFTADKNSTVYIADTTNRNTLHIYPVNPSSKISIQVPDYITQLMCIDGATILVFTPGGVYTLIDTGLSKIPQIKPVAPCRYVADGIITDNNGENFLYSEGTLKPAYSAPQNSSPATDIAIKDNYIYIPSGTTYAALCKSFDLNKSEFKVYKQDFSEFTLGKLGTGMSAVYDNKEYTIIVRGDLTGEGNVNSRDLKVLMEHLTGEVLLSEISAKAADVYCDNLINTKDLLILKSLY